MEIKNPTFSIIIPCYNQARYLRHSIESVIFQENKDWEIIIIDDGSNDHPEKIVKDIQEKYKKLPLYFYAQINQGPSAARNAGINKAKGDYICLLDADDIFMRVKLSELMVLIERIEPEFIYHDFIYFKTDLPKKLFRPQEIKRQKDILNDLLHKNFIATDSICIKKDIFNKFGYFDETLQYHEDWELLLRLAMHGVVFQHLPKILTHVRIHKSSISHNLVKMAEGRIQVLKNIKEKSISTNKIKFDFDKHIFYDSVYSNFINIESGAYRKSAKNILNLIKSYKRVSILALFSLLLCFIGNKKINNSILKALRNVRTAII